jgi:hypothetical protein
LGLGIERLLLLLQELAMPCRRRRRTPMPSSRPGTPLPQAVVAGAGSAARRRRVKVQQHAGGADGPGSMKSQFKKADASGASFALVFGADELAQGQVTVKHLRAGGEQATQPLADPPPGPGLASVTTIPGTTGQHMARHLDLEEQEQLDELKHFWKQWGNLITWVADRRPRRLRGLERLAVLAAHQAAKASALYDEVERAARRRRQAPREQALKDMKGQVRRAPPTRSRRRCWRPRCWPTRARPTPPRPT